MQNAIINSCNTFGNSASICCARAMVAGGDVLAKRQRAWKRLHRVDVPVVPGRVYTSGVSVRESLQERPATRETTAGAPTSPTVAMPPAKWQSAKFELPAAAWAALVIARAHSV